MGILHNASAPKRHSTFATCTMLKAFVRIIGMQSLSSSECQKRGFVIPAAIEQSPGSTSVDAFIQAEQRTGRLDVPCSLSCHLEEPGNEKRHLHTQHKTTSIMISTSGGVY